ncbi:MAG: hypothetical protein WBV73_30185, partial [Phormidium sp.]
RDVVYNVSTIYTHSSTSHRKLTVYRLLIDFSSTFQIYLKPGNSSLETKILREVAAELKSLLNSCII